MKTARIIVFNWKRDEPVDPMRIRKRSPGGGWVMARASSALLEQELEDRIEVIVDVEALVDLIAQKAAQAETGKASAMGGRLRARRLARKILSSRRSVIPKPVGYETVHEDPGFADPHSELGYGR